jgi:2-polyprenyl-6-methoxyphenol hydroxylase-like FAD-dependent oxidoreductase
LLTIDFSARRILVGINSSLRIAVIGAGSGGPAAAGLLAAQGHEVTLYEQAPQKLPIGAGFLLQPTGMRVLEHMGILDTLLPKVARIDHLYCENQRGQVLLDLRYEELGAGYFGAGTHRATFLDHLLDYAAAVGVRVEWNQRMQSMQRDEKNLVRLTDANGQVHGPFDLVIIADGARSQLRSQLPIPTRVDRYPWGALWYVGRRTDDFHPHQLWQKVQSTDVLNGFLPTGTDDDLLSLFWSVRADDFDTWKGQSLEALKEKILQFTPQAEKFLTQLVDVDQLQTAAYYDVRMSHWHADRVAILGDAAHALSPQLGQGVNLALMDAYVLADCIKTQPLEAALALYSQRRRDHVRFYQFATRWSTPFFQSDYPALGWLRDTFFPLANYVPWARRQMSMTMAGCKTGPFSQREFLPARHPRSTLSKKLAADDFEDEGL